MCFINTCRCYKFKCGSTKKIFTQYLSDTPQQVWFKSYKYIVYPPPSLYYYQQTMNYTKSLLYHAYVVYLEQYGTLINNNIVINLE